MSDLTSELNLSLCLDGDDTADYLTLALRDSLNVLDGLFSSSTGHSHSGAHQGGSLEFIDLSLDGNLTVSGSSTLQSAVYAQSTLTVSDTATLASLHVTGTTQLDGAVDHLTLTNSLNVGLDETVGRNLQVNGTLNCNNTISSGANVTALGVIAAGPPISATSGDLNSNRGNGTGIVFLGNTTHYLTFDGSYYHLPATPLYVNNDLVISATAVQSMSNKTFQGGSVNSATLTSPSLAGTVAGAPAWSSGQTFPSVISSAQVGVGSYLYFPGAAAQSGAIRLVGDNQILWRCAGSDYGIWYDSGGRLNFHLGGPGIAGGAAAGSVALPAQCRGFLQVAIPGIGNCKIPIYNN